MQHPFLQKFLQNNEPWLPRALALAAAYLLVRGLFLGVGGMFFLGLFCLASVLFGALLNAVYGRLPHYFPTEHKQSDWQKWYLSSFYLGNPGKTAQENKTKETNMVRNMTYFCFVLFIVADIEIALFGDIALSGNSQASNETGQKEVLALGLIFFPLCFVLFSFNIRVCTMPMGSFKFWMHNEVYWVKCLYLFLFFFVLAAFLLMAAISEEGKEVLYAILFNLLLALPFGLIYYLSYYCLVRIGDKIPWVKPFYMSLFFLVLLAVLFAIFSVETLIIKGSLAFLFGVLSMIFMLCVLYLVRNKK